EAEYWVKVPSVSGTVDTEIYIYYTTTVTADGAEPESVWDENYVMVQHMKDNTTSATLDSTGNDNDGTKKAANEPVEITGQIVKGQSFDGNDDKINVGNKNSLNTINNFTIEAFIKSDDSNYGHIFAKGNDGSNGDYYLMRIDVGHQILCGWNSGTVEGQRIGISTNLNNNTWAYVAGVRDVTHTYVYVNDTREDGAENIGDAGQINPGYDAYIGPLKWNGADAHYYKGLIDELRVSNIVRSASWLKASYNSGNNTLLACEDEEVLP
ncbi:MAG: LamG domain-containing protein, partial [Candidatus Paceibacterota bacterium]